MAPTEVHHAATDALAAVFSEHAPVLRGALSCVLRLLDAHPEGAAPTADTLKLFRWLLEFVVHPSPKVRSRAPPGAVSAVP